MNGDEQPYQLLLEPVFETRRSLEESFRTTSSYNDSLKLEKLLLLFTKENLLNNFTLNYFLKFGSIRNIATSLFSDSDKGLDAKNSEVLEFSRLSFGKNERKKDVWRSLTRVK
jgi:hypothetical protein